MNEIWKDIEGYEGLYQVSNLGRVRSLDRVIYKTMSKTGRVCPFNIKGRVLKPGTDTKGYLFVNLKNAPIVEEARVHRLVAQAFVDGWFEGAVVNHKDENRQNNRADNLEWVTFSDNLNYGTARQRSTEKHGYSRPVLQMDLDGNIIKEYPSVMEASRQTGISDNAIRHCCHGHNGAKTASGYRWRFKE